MRNTQSSSSYEQFGRVGSPEASLKYRHPIQVDLCASRLVHQGRAHWVEAQ